MANNYTPSYNQYLTQTAGYALPSSVRTYSVFDPASNSWRRMTNDGRSPMPASPAQQQANIAGALAQARQTQGTVYPAQGMGQGQPVEVHPGYLNPPAQTPVQTPSRIPAQTPVGGSRTPSPASGGGGAVPVQGQPSRASQRAVEAPAAVQAGNPYMGYAESRREFEDPDAFLRETPRGTAGAQGQRMPSVFVAPNEAPAEVQQMFQPQGRLIPQFDVDKADRPFLGHERDMLAQGFYRASDLANQAGQMYLGGQIAGPLINLGKGVLVGRAAQSAAPAANGSLAGFVDSLNAANTPATRALKVQEMRDIMNASRASKPMGVGRGLSTQNIEAVNRFSPLRSDWVSPKTNVRMNSFVTTPNGTVYRYKPMLGYDTPALPAPKVEVPTGRINPIQTPEVITPYGGFRALPNGAGNLHMGTIEAGGVRSNIASPLQMTTPSGLARWQYRLDQLSGLGR